MKIFATDYDGTLYVNDKDIKKTNKLLKKLKENNFLIVIATGRGYPSIKNQTNIHNILYDYIICCDGSVIYNNNGNIEKMFPINKEIIKPFTEFYQNVKFEELQFSYPTGYSNLLNKDDDDLLGVNVCVSNENYTKELVDKFILMSKSYPNYSFLNYMHVNYSFLCIKPKGINKSTGIEYLRKKYKVLKKDIYTIGDASNDYQMIKDYNGSCIYNSFPEILEISKKKYRNVNDYIIDILKED